MRILLLILLLPAPLLAQSWETKAPGLEYRALPSGHAFRIDLKQIEPRIVRAPKQGATLAELRTGDDALLAVNGGYFDPQMRSLGLLVSQNRELNSLRKADWGVLMVDLQHRARLIHTRDYKRMKSTAFAIQAGPRLLVAGKPTSLKPQWGRRTALGITKERTTVILVVTTESMLLSRLAEVFVELGCDYALNLDGGSSTQLSTRLSGIENVKGVRVANAVVFAPRK